MIRMPTCVHGNIRTLNSKFWHSNDKRITSILFSGSTLRFLMTTENQDLISASFSQYCVPSLSPSCCNRPWQITGWAPPAGHSNTSKSNLSISCSFWYWPGFQFQPFLASVVNQASTAGIVNISSMFVCLLIYTCLSFSVFQHDSGSDCTPGEAKTQDQKERGNYIMYARATSGDKFNNNKFSICSIRNISQVLDKKRFSCFVGEILSSNKKMAHDSGLRLRAGNQERLLQILLRWTQMRHLTWDCSRRIVTCNELMAMFCSNVASKLQKTNSTSPNHAAMIKQ